MLTLVPLTLAEGRRFVAEHHRHNIPPVGWKWGVGVAEDGQLVGVAIASRPVARALDDGLTLEVTRTCTTGAKNANSMLYGAICRAAKALGYRRVLTYTLESEPGSSLRAAGFTLDAAGVGGPPKAWGASRARYTETLFGDKRLPDEPKVRWIREVA